MSLPPHVSPFHADRGPTGVLLTHGFTGSPASMRPWGEHLAADGFTVSVPRLPGHGTTWRELNSTTWQDWYAEVSRSLDALRDSCEEVFVTGLSMGGCLALRLAEERGDDVAGLILVNPSVASTDKRLVALPLLKRLVPSLPGIGNDIKKPGAEEHCYDRTPLKALDSLRQMWKLTREDLPKVTSPLLVFRSVEDHVVKPLSAQIITQRVSSRDVTERVLDNSYHVATLDYDADSIFTESAEFISKRTSGPGG
ncbi:MAG: alpha/beta fold hydrolase [Propionibacteriales bacterium]|nr:alpha/beta fold hydrolase [Propionibacteriales bacterium]